MNGARSKSIGSSGPGSDGSAARRCNIAPAPKRSIGTSGASATTASPESGELGSSSLDAEQAASVASGKRREIVRSWFIDAYLRPELRGPLASVTPGFAFFELIFRLEGAVTGRAVAR